MTAALAFCFGAFFPTLDISASSAAAKALASAFFLAASAAAAALRSLSCCALVSLPAAGTECFHMHAQPACSKWVCALYTAAVRCA